MNILKIADGITTLFPRKTTVTFINAEDNVTIGSYKMDADQLPGSFTKPTIIKINNEDWHVVKADLIYDESILRGKKLKLHVQPATNRNRKDSHLDYPTICPILPGLDSHTPTDDFTIEVQRGDWRQIEFLSVDLLPNIAQDISAVQLILANHPNALLGYTQQHVREQTASYLPGLNAAALADLLGNKQLGTVSLKPGGYVKNGFAIQSESYSYYGVLENDAVSAICLTQFECADEELMTMLAKYRLVLVDWCNARVLSAEISNSGSTIEETDQDISSLTI